LAAPARAGEEGGDQDTVQLEATVGLDGKVGLSRAYPVIVDVASPRLLSGTLRVTGLNDMGRDVIQRPIEVAGGTTKRFALTVGTSTGFGGDRVTVDVIADGKTVANVDLPVVADGEEELVGVLPGLLPSLDRDTVPLAVDVGQARLGAIPPEVLAEGPLGIEVYDQIAASGGDLDDLSDTDQRTLAQWVGQGGHLLLDGGDPAELLPDGFDPSPGVARVVGHGRVRLTDGALAAGRWDEVLLPTPVQSQAEEEIMASGLSVQGDVTSSLVADSGFDLPSIRTLLLVLAGYIFLVGPIAWFVVRRRRTTLLWGIIPAVALLTTALLQVAGSEFRESDDSVHVTMIETSPGGAMATTSIFVTGRSDATTLDLPAGWRTARNPFFGGGFGFDERPTPVTRLGDRSQVPIDPGVGGAALLRLRGPVDLDGGLVITAGSDTDGVMRGTVENTLDVPLEDVAVFIARTSGVEVGDLAPGASAEWEADDATRFEFGADPESRIWPMDVDSSVFGFGAGEVRIDPRTGMELAGDQVGDVTQIASSLSAYGDLVSERGTSFKPQGQAVAVGWTRDLDAPLRVGGRTVSKGRTGIVARTEATSEGGRLVDTGAVQHLVRGPATAGIIAAGDLAEGNSVTAVYGFDLPSGVGERDVDESRLTLHVSGLFTRVQVWARGEWQDLPTGDGEVELPPGAVIDQTVFSRVEIPIDQAPGPGRAFVLYEAET
jgi:hypothetical protein